MKHLKSLLFIALFVGLGILAFAAMPYAPDTATASAPVAPVVEVVANETEAFLATNNWTNIAVPLIVPSAPTADQVAYYIDPAPSSIKQVAYWDEVAQSMVIRNVGAPFGVPNFPVATGDWLMVAADATAPVSFAWVGDVPAIGSRQYTTVASGFTDLMLPLDRSDLTTADALGNDIGVVTQVARWDSANQGLVIRNVNAPFGVPNYNITPGYPYLVNASAIVTWPQ
jgi:hypothetical protein